MPDRTNEGEQMSRTDDKPGQPTNKERREVFKKLGKYAAYTAPVVIAILVSEKGYAQPVPPPAPPPPTPPPPA